MNYKFDNYFKYLKNTSLENLSVELKAKVDDYFENLKHGDIERWVEALENLPDIKASVVNYNKGAVKIGAVKDGDAETIALVKDVLMEFHPWRKGPFKVFGIKVDTEWRSDMKWERLAGKIELKDKLVLDVGCGNGYYCYRMLGAGAKLVVGVDPMLLYVMQFLALNKYAGEDRCAVLPLGVDDVPCDVGCFGTVFSMGILYHRREPVEHLKQLFGFIKSGGEAVIETLVLEGEGEELLVPEGRYAKMRNVWNIATVSLIKKWIIEAGFGSVEVLGVCKTTFEEQRKTEWMKFESLEDFMNKKTDSLTVEGYPGPVRGMFLAQKK